MNENRRLGTLWEREAELFLQQKGLRTVRRNFNCRLGEIDLVMEDGECLVFAEIRYRRNSGHGTGAESVSKTKQSRIIRAAQLYLKLHPHRANQACRFDVLSLEQVQGKLSVDWVRSAFTA